MIVVRLIGGLGNQMFQYAAGRSLARHRNTELYLDLSFLTIDPKGAYTKREFELKGFNIKAGIADKDILEKFDLTTGRLITKIKSKLPQFFNSLVYNESGSGYDKNFFELPENTYLNGYWQNQTYFLLHRNELTKEFELKDKPGKDYDNYLESITATHSVGIHVRRGDYVSLEAAQKFHGVLSTDYYKRGMEYLAGKHKDLNYFVFSDDVAWCKQNFDFVGKVNFVEAKNPGLQAYEELLLMSRCKHSIIANSSFSWWAAWLNGNPDKIVIAPEYWFAETKSKTLEVLPRDWIIL